MRVTIPRSKMLFGLLFTLLTSNLSAAWEQISVDESLLETLFGSDRLVKNDEGRPGFIDDKGIQRFPGCSEAPNAAGFPDVKPFDGTFSFFVERSRYAYRDDNEDLLLFFSGGGACWNSGTCLDSLLTDNPSYSPYVSETAEGLDALSSDPDGAAGVLAYRRDNPFRSYAKVYIPYCTGDIHLGSNDQEYLFSALAPATWTIRHRGFDNLEVVLRWLELRRNRQFHDLDHVVIAGTSAGGYGALANAPIIMDALGGLEYQLIVDSANGVLTNGFADAVFGRNGKQGVWGTDSTLHPLIKRTLDLDANELWTRAFVNVGRNYRKLRIAQSTTAFDSGQTAFLLTMQLVDANQFDPSLPFDSSELFASAVFDWGPRARGAMQTTADWLRNYRYYRAAGVGHQHLIDPPEDLGRFPTPNFFTERSAEGVAYPAWIRSLLNNSYYWYWSSWRNLDCEPFCFPL